MPTITFPAPFTARYVKTGADLSTRVEKREWRYRKEILFL
jgi:hypothetical protein